MSFVSRFSIMFWVGATALTSNCSKDTHGSKKNPLSSGVLGKKDSSDAGVADGSPNTLSPSIAPATSSTAGTTATPTLSPTVAPIASPTVVPTTAPGNNTVTNPVLKPTQPPSTTVKEPVKDGCYIDLQTCPNNAHVPFPVMTLGKLFLDNYNGASGDSEACKRRAHEYASFCAVMYPRSVTSMFYKNGDRTMIIAGHNPGCYASISGCSKFDDLKIPQPGGWTQDQSDESLKTGLQRDKCYQRKQAIISWCQDGGSASPSVRVIHINNWGIADGEW